jgi:hypothetical protein
VRSENEASGTHGAQTRGDEQLMVLQMTVRWNGNIAILICKTNMG